MLSGRPRTRFVPHSCAAMTTTYTADLWPLSAAGRTVSAAATACRQYFAGWCGRTVYARTVAFVSIGTRDVIIGKRSPSGGWDTALSDRDRRRGRDNELKNSIIAFRQLPDVGFVVSCERSSTYRGEIIV